MTKQTTSESLKPKYLQKYVGTDRRGDKIQNTALLEVNFNFSSVKAIYSENAGGKIEQLLVMINERLNHRLRDTDTVLQVNQKFIILLEEVEIIAHANTVSDELVKMLKEPFILAEDHHIRIETTISINLFSKFDLKLAAFPRKIKLDK
jgi:GGDEF domain-containing protein